jgi:hypothetical protein
MGLVCWAASAQTTTDTLQIGDSVTHTLIVNDSVAVVDTTDSTAQVQETIPVKREVVFVKSGLVADTIYSVQLTTGQDSLQVAEAKEEFSKWYPQTEAFIVYEDPFYKLRAGRYSTRKKAEEKQRELREDYENCFITHQLTKSRAAPGEYTVHQDDRIDRLVEKYTSLNAENPTITRYRIQVFSSSKRQKVLKKKSELQQQYPDYDYQLIYEAPYFKLRVGNYQDIWEAKRVRHKLSEEIKNAFIVKEKRKPDELEED